MDSLRGFAILMVVAYHATDLTLAFVPDTPGWLTAPNEALSPFRMATLVLLSGMLARSSMDKGSRTYVMGKLRMIAWPYVVWTLISVSIVVAGRWFVGNEPDAGGLFLSVLRQESYTWFLLYILCFYLLALALRQVPRVPLVFAALVVAALANDYEYFQRFWYLFAFFIIGDVINQKALVVVGWVGKAWVLAACAAGAGASFSYSAFGGEARYSPVWVWSTVAGVLLMIGLASKIQGTGTSRRLAAIGRESIKYYTVHFVVMFVTVRLLVVVADLPSVAVVLLVLLVGIGSGALAAALTRGDSRLNLLFAWPRRPWFRVTNRTAAGSGSDK